jgi:hypothetical protein
MWIRNACYVICGLEILLTGTNLNVFDLLEMLYSYVC